jgi:homocysteine S-methyltransferase
MKTPFLQILKERVVLGDGAIGTYLYEKGVDYGENTDLLNLVEPDLVFSVHEDYIRAGAEVIETNTFGANRFKLKPNKVPNKGYEDRVREINLAAAALALRAAGKDIYVAGSVGPTGADFPLYSDITRDDVKAAFLEQISALLEGGVDLLFIETFTYLEELLIAIEAARDLSRDIPVAGQMVFPTQGKTALGLDAGSCADAAAVKGASIFGSNCGRGVKATLQAIERLSSLKDRIPLSAFPNAGLPEIVGHRTVYSAQPAYMAKSIAEMTRLGARLVGGCCGTTPIHIHEFKKALHLKKTHAMAFVSLNIQGEEKNESTDGGRHGRGGLLEGLRPGRIPVLVELDPPQHLDVTGTIEGAKSLSASGADAITLAEHPLAILRADNLSLAHLIRSETGMQAVMHLTCRDRNVLGLEAQIMGAHLLGIEAILAITGDPASSSDQPGANGVFDLNSIGLTRLINQFNHGYNLAGSPMRKKTNFSIGAAFSYRPSNPGLQIKRLEQKIANGANFVMTQPIFDAADAEGMMEAAANLDIPIFVGVFPLLSARNADFLHNEIPGITIPSSIRRTLWSYEKTDDQRRAAMEFTEDLITKIAPWADGLYIISPLNKWEVSSALVKMVRDAGFKGSGRATV